MTLQDRINEIAAQEAAWLAEGHPVAIVSNTVAWWNERGIFTAADLDAHFAGDPHASTADQSLWDGYEAWLDRNEALMIAEMDAMDAAEALLPEDFPVEPVYQIANQYQSGWM